MQKLHQLACKVSYCHHKKFMSLENCDEMKMRCAFWIVNDVICWLFVTHPLELCYSSKVWGAREVKLYHWISQILFKTYIKKETWSNCKRRTYSHLWIFGKQEHMPCLHNPKTFKLISINTLALTTIHYF